MPRASNRFSPKAKATRIPRASDHTFAVMYFTTTAGSLSVTRPLCATAGAAPRSDPPADQLARIRDGLRTLIKACPGHGALDACPILHALDEDAA